MKWKNPPLSLFALPPFLGLVSAFVGFAHASMLLPMMDIDPQSFFGALLPLFSSWLVLLIFTAAFVNIIPHDWGDPEEIRLGVWFGIGAVFLPQICGVALILCAFWFLAVIGAWLFMSSYQWKYDAPPFRTGMWLGLGGLSGMFIGAFFFGLFMNV